jgi:hypothetical protein
LSYSGDKTTYTERGLLRNEQTFLDLPLGKGHLLYFTVPLEFSDQINTVGRIYKFAMKYAGVKTVYETLCEDPGMLICPTQLPNATLYVFTSESSSFVPFSFKDSESKTNFHITLEPGRAALMLIGKDGQIISSYNAR